MNDSVVVYGPPACGKTKNKEKIAKRFGLTEIVDDWCEEDEFSPQGVLYLTNAEPSEKLENSYTLIFSYYDLDL